MFQVEKEKRQARAGAGKLGGTRGGLGDGGATWRSEEGASRGREATGGVQEWHVARREAAWGQLELSTWPARAAGSSREKTERGGLEVDEGGFICNLSKVQELHCKAKLTFKP
jgi:hypothetical protein